MNKRAFCRKRTMSRGMVSKLSKLIVLCVLVTGVAIGQSQSDDHVYGTEKGNSADLAVAMDKLRQGNFSTIHLEVIAEADERQAIPILENQFVHNQDQFTKLKLAQVLVRLGDRDNRYWDFLLKQATLAVESPAPELVDAQGKVVPGGLSPKFLAWTKAHDIEPDAVYGIPGRVLLLGATGDSRGIPLLRQALESPNPYIENVAALGLAEIQDKASVPFIIEACRKARPDVASAIAQALIYFDDSQAKCS